MKGKLYGIGAGPGDPELLTIKAVNAIRACGAIAAPKTGGGDGAALSIIKGYLDGKELLEFRFSMDKDIEKRKGSRMSAALRITGFLDRGTDVGFVTLGDPATYSTYMYIHEIIAEKGFETEMIPGVTSYSAAAAALKIALCEGGEVLTIIPASYGDDIERLLSIPGNKIIMKSGENLANVFDTLKKHGLGGRTKIAYRATMDGQRLYASIGEYEQSPEHGYFTLAIVK